MPATEGWTQVTKDRSRRFGRIAPATTTTTVPPPLKDYDIERLRADLHSKARLWKGSTCRKKLFQILDQKRPESGWDLNRAMCLASGSFSRENWEGRKRSVLQFVAFMDIVERLSMTSSGQIAVCAQEPVFTVLDEELLLDAGVDVLESPQAETLLDTRTFAFVPFMERDTDAVRALAATDLHLYIGTPLPNDSAGEHDFYFLPTFEEDPNVFEGLILRWRVPATEEGN